MKSKKPKKESSSLAVRRMVFLKTFYPFIDQKLTIPAFQGNSSGRAESLNASIATAIICYAFRNILQSRNLIIYYHWSGFNNYYFCNQNIIEMFLKLVLISIVFIALAFSGVAVKMLFKKNYTFKKQCSSVDPNTGKAIGCSCGGAGDGSCRTDDGKEKPIR